MVWFRRPPGVAPTEDHRTEKVIARLEAVANRMERMTVALEAQLKAEEEIDAEQRRSLDDGDPDVAGRTDGPPR